MQRKEENHAYWKLLKVCNQKILLMCQISINKKSSNFSKRFLKSKTFQNVVLMIYSKFYSQIHSWRDLPTEREEVYQEAERNSSSLRVPEDKLIMMTKQPKLNMKMNYLDSNVFITP